MPNVNSIQILFIWAMVLSGTLSGGCTRDEPNVAENDTDSDTDTDSDIDSDSDADSDDTDTLDSMCEVDTTLPKGDADDLFNSNHVPTFDIYLPEDKWEDLTAHAMDEEWEQAEVCYDGKRIGSIGIRFKGSYGTLYSCFDEAGKLTCPRLSLKLKFSKYDEDLRFFGLKRLNFNANRYDDSRMREKLAYDLYRSMDVIAPRASWAVVRVNGKSYGLYGMVEELDGRFTESRWPAYPDGNLFKELWPTDTDEDDIVAALRTNEDTPEVSGFMKFSEAMTDAETDEAVLQVLGQYTDLNQWARYMAVDEAILSYDGITYFFTDDGSWSHNHNYYFYEDSTEHFTLVPWDVESSFWINPDHATPHWLDLPDDCSTTYPYWGNLATAPGCNPVFRALKTDLGPWRAAARELLDGPFAEETILAKIDAHEALIGQYARAKETPTEYTTFDYALTDVRNTVRQLRSRLEGLIADE